MAEQTENVDIKQIHWLSYILYYCLLFFAHWFGASRFDIDGDGDFDPSDVEAFLRDKHLFLEKNYTRSEAAMQRIQIKKSKSNLGDVEAGSKSPKASSRKPSTESDLSTAGFLSKSKIEPATKPAPVGKPAQQVAEDEHHGEHTEGDEHNPEHHEDQGMRARLSAFLDRDGDGHVDARDLMFSAVEGGIAEEDDAIKKLTSGQLIPLFILFEILVCGALWIIWAGIKSGETGDFFSTKGGLDSFWDERTDLRFYGDECVDLRPEAWRWVTYQWTHVGATHVGFNIFLCIMLGIPLEGVHGHLRVATMFNSGVVGGAFANFIFDQHNAVVGCSGGCYALIGIHVADLVMNWAQKKFRLPTLILLSVLVAADIGSNVASHPEGVSHAAHVGGFYMGVITGICLGKNMVWKCYEKVLAGMAAVLGLAYAVFCLAWLYTREHGAENLFDAGAGTVGYCWVNQAWNSTWGIVHWQCVKCSTHDCVLRWQSSALCSAVIEDQTCPVAGYRFVEGK